MTITEQPRTEPVSNGARAPEPTPADTRDAPLAPIHAWSGLVAALMVAVGFLAPGMLPPRIDQSTAQVLRLFEAHRLLVLSTLLMYSIGSVAFLWFCGYLITEFGTGRSKLSAYTAALGAAFATGVLTVGQIVTYGVVLSMDHVRAAGPGATRLLVDLGSEIMNAGKWGMSLFVVAAGVAAYQNGAISRRNMILGIVTSVLLAFGSVGAFFASRGTWEFGQVIEIPFSVPMLFWVPVFSVILARRAGRLRAGAVQSLKG